MSKPLTRYFCNTCGFEHESIPVITYRLYGKNNVKKGGKNDQYKKSRIEKN